MRAVIVPEPGEADALRVTELPTPEPAAGEVLVRVAAAGVNRADVLQRRGFYDPPAGATPVLGLEASGTVAAVGEGVDASWIGREIVALLVGGGYAEYVAVPAGQVAPVPEGIDLVTAGGVMEAAATVWSNVVMVGRLVAGETFLVHGGTSGIGTMAIQVAKALGARVVTTVGSQEKAQVCRDLGADLVVNYREQDFGDALKEAGLRPDVILDIMGASYLDANVRALATGGRLVVIGLQGGIKGTLDLNRLLMKRASVTATSLRARPAQEKSAIVAEIGEHVWPLIASGTVRPVVHARFGLDDAAEAHRVMEASTHVGKLLLLP
ncbi:MAG: NAD(P)H-quinone oxidoreductase [Aeromicrobium sp.]|uniref:NAD(P)H-quinone oxidoreductase n=1 Tax=Aeromicrobium sp. TaxID=1871063 RepID=UPI0039E52F69